MSANQSSPTNARRRCLEKLPHAATRMGVSLTQVYREIKNKRLGPIVKTGERSSAIESHSVDAWIEARVAEASARQLAEAKRSGQAD